MQAQYLPVLIALIFSGFFVFALLGLSHLLGPRNDYPEKQVPYECGVPPEGSPRHPFSIKFYLIALFFILFDIEIVFLFPWAVVYRKLVPHAGLVILVDVAIFIGVLLVGLAYIWRKGALEWE
ncbi:NADH-quinone oxidoreductase subunit A [Bdellovibrionota bacterium]